MGYIAIGVARAVLATDTEPLRFELFCCDLLAELEGVPVVPTSASWDKGKDGRSVGRGPRILVCATLTTKLDAKVREDLRKAFKAPQAVDKLYYCTSQASTSEHSLDEILADIQRDLGVSVVTEGLSGYQLAKLTATWPASMRKHYASELEGLLRTLIGDAAEDDGSFRESSLLALSTTVHANSSAIRSAAYRQVVLRALRDRREARPHSIGSLCVEVSNRLKLGLVLPERALRPHLDELVASQKVVSDGEQYVLAPDGQLEVEDADSRATEQLLSGRARIREALEHSLGFAFYDSQYSEIWSAVQGRLTHFFYVGGRRMMSVINSFSQVGGRIDRGEPTQDLPFFVEELADAAASVCSQSELAEQVRTAIKDLFSERCGVAYDWLTSVAASFVLICALGLEMTSGSRLRDTIAATHLVLDTDVVLELLGEGEPGNESARALVREWRQHGGTILVAHPVAEEVAYHAWIADAEFREIGDRFSKSEVDRRRFVKNLFLRSFGHMMERFGTSPARWRAYIQMFQGKTADDTSRLFQTLRGDHAMKVLPDVDLKSDPSASVWEALSGRMRGGNGRAKKIEADKARRDARLFGSLFHYASALAETGRGEACVLVTSAGRLHYLADDFEEYAQQTLTLPEAVYCLAMVPGVSLGLTAMRAALFDGRLLPRNDALDLLVMRAVRESGEWDVPWAQRTTLCRQVREHLFNSAKIHGKPELSPQEVASEAATEPEAREALTHSIAKALHDLAAESKAEKELEEARRTIKELEARLARRNS